VPDDPDADQIRGQAIDTLIRAAERAERTGAPALAAASYAAAATLTSPGNSEGEHAAGGRPSAGVLWERAARAADISADWAAAIAHAGRARAYHLDCGQTRAAARAQGTAGRALRRSGHHAEAREQLTAAVDVLRADPDADTVRALDELALVGIFTGSSDADRLSAEALTLGQALDVGARQLSSLRHTRAIYIDSTEWHTEAVAYLREAARLATQAGNNIALGRALVSLSDVLAAADPAAAAETARSAAGHLRSAGARDTFTYAIGNLAQALLMLGDWDAAEAELTQAADADGLADRERLTCYRGWLAALRGDTATAETMLAGLADLRVTEDIQDKSLVSLVQAFTAAAYGQPRNTLRLAHGTLAHAGALGIGHEFLRWAWPLAARATHDLHDTAATGDLLALLDSYQPGHIAPMLRAERDLARARLAADSDDSAAGAAFAAAVGALRELSTPYHLAHGLLDHAGYLTRLGNAVAAAAAAKEARDIAGNLHCQPLLGRAADTTLAKSPV
jgi:hypothetical protein